ncbi:MAG TPA: porin [Cytophagales bacterium]|nr:porin [Cytophagales bacterium]
MKKKFYLILLVILTAFSSYGQDSVSTGSLTITGYVDTYYQYNLNSPSDRKNGGRIFDVYHNNFSLGLVQTAFKYTYGKAEAVLDLTYGPNAELGNFGNSGTSKIIKQAYLAYGFTDKLKFTIGQFGTHIGYELIDAPLNYNYSLSYLFGNGPFYHTGAKLNYTFSDKAGIMVGVVNGWDGLQDFNDKKSLAAQVFVSPVEGVNLYLNWIGGDEYNTLSAFGSKKGSFTNLFDLTGTVAASDKISLGVNAAYGMFSSGYAKEITDEDIAAADPVSAGILEADQGKYDKDASWFGVAGYANVAFNDVFGLGLRVEHFNDPDGVRYFGPLVVNALTATANIALAEGRFNIKPEIRFDAADSEFFVENEGKAKKTQTTLGSAFILKF